MKRLAVPALLVPVLLSGCPQQSVPAAQDPPKTVARVDGQAITEEELMAEAKAPIAAAEARFAEEIHGVKIHTLEAMIDQRLLEAKAKSEGITVEALLDREVGSKVAEPDEEYLRSVYDTTKANGKTVPPYDDAKADIVRFVKNAWSQDLRSSYLAKLRADAKVETLLRPPLPAKVEVAAEGPSKGDGNAPITIVEFSDYECRFCAAAEHSVGQVMDAYKGKVRVVFRSYPLSIHEDAYKASEAALCAGEQGKYWDMHSMLFAHQHALKVEDLKGYARSLGVDAAAFDTCLDTGRMKGVVEADRKAGDGAGVTATPTFFINGRPISGSPPFETWKEIIDYELSTAGR
ncbi:MAG: thioredoxin domain-containing protein [Acidobacteriota bacterium]